MSDVLFETVGKAGLVTLNRPDALNALSEEMIRLMGEALDEWAIDDAVERVAIRAEGRAFCAGGDLRDLYRRRSDAIDFFRAEYTHNARVKRFAKPYVALIDGICMGGGVGVSVHGSHRVASEKLVFAMPETGIGLFADVGASHVLGELPDNTGLYLALTGARWSRDEAAAEGLVTHPVNTERLLDALDRTAHAKDIDVALGEIKVATAPREEDEIALIARTFDGPSVAAIIEALDEDKESVAADLATTLRTKSPTSLAVTFAAVRGADILSFEEVMQRDFRIVSHMLDGPDLYEGIRALVVDKDGSPKWSPASIEAVDAEAVDAHFAPCEHDALRLPEPPDASQS